MNGHCLSTTHLRRCSVCKVFVLDSDVQCWQCGSQRAGYRAFRVVALASQAVPLILILGLMAASIGYAVKARIARDEEEMWQKESEWSQRESQRRELERPISASRTAAQWPFPAARNRRPDSLETF